MSQRREPQTMREVADFATISVKTVSGLTGLGANQTRAALQRGEIPGLAIIGGRWLVLTQPFLAWARGEEGQ